MSILECITANISLIDVSQNYAESNSITKCLGIFMKMSISKFFPLHAQFETRGKKRRKFQRRSKSFDQTPYCQTSLYAVLISASSTVAVKVEEKTYPKKSGQQSNKGLSEIGPKEVNIWQKCLTYLKWEEFTQIVSASKSQARSSEENKSFLQSSCLFDQKQWQGHHIVSKTIQCFHHQISGSTYMRGVAVVVDTHRHCLYPGITQ